MKLINTINIGKKLYANPDYRRQYLPWPMYHQMDRDAAEQWCNKLLISIERNISPDQIREQIKKEIE